MFIEPAYCPECAPYVAKNGKQRRIELALVDTNYSGCGVDIGECPVCGQLFQVSYKIDKITRFK
jgi:Pyruvate/2-oxoacid:ferredoxin oxidoreductase delta subunit